MANISDSVRERLSTCLARMPLFLPTRILVDLLELELHLRSENTMAMKVVVSFLVAVAEASCFNPMFLPLYISMSCSNTDLYISSFASSQENRDAGLDAKLIPNAIGNPRFCCYDLAQMFTFVS